MSEDDSAFLEILCKSSGKIRRFAKGTDSQFALELINQRLGDNHSHASYIQAVKNGEEPIFFGPKSILKDYGPNWKLETVPINKGTVTTMVPLCENDHGRELPLQQYVDGGHKKQNGIESVMAQFDDDEGSENENGIDLTLEPSSSNQDFGKNDDMEVIIDQFRTYEELGKETTFEPIWKQFSTDDGVEKENVLEPTAEQSAADKGVRKKSAQKSTLKKTPDLSVYPNLPSPEPLSLIVSNYGSDEEEREWAVADPNGDYPDLTEAFATSTEFKGKEEIVEWCKKVGSENGTVIIIGRSDCEKSGRRPRVHLRCERSGTVKDRRRPPPPAGKVIRKRQRNTPTKKCDCPFKIKGTLLNNGKWEVKVICGTHNHPLLESIDGHPTYARLTKEEAALVTQLSMAGFKPSQMLDALKRRDPNNVSTLPTIYNFRNKRGLTKSTRKPWEMVPSP